MSRRPSLGGSDLTPLARRRFYSGPRGCQQNQNILSIVLFLGKTTITNWTRPKLEVACVIDIPTYRNHREGAERERVFEDVKFACGGIPDSVVHHIQFDRLDFGVGEVLDKFYAADVAIIDLSVQVLLNLLFYIYFYGYDLTTQILNNE